MLKQLFLVISVGMIAFGQETGKTRLLTPRADSHTAMRRCGAELENAKVQNQLMRHYVFTGEEILTGMQYCVEGKHALTDDRYAYQVPAGTIGWLSEDGQRVVLEQCVNMARCTGCPPKPPEQPEAPAPRAEVAKSKPVELTELKALPDAPEWPEADETKILLTYDKHRDVLKYVPCVGFVAHPTKGRALYCGIVVGGVVGGIVASGGSATIAVGSKVVPIGGVISPFEFVL